jgi:S-formylglutathione hydrolase FrmB
MRTRIRKSLVVLTALLSLCLAALAQSPATPQRLRFHVTLSPDLGKTAASGRLLILISKSKGQHDQLRPSDTDPSATWITAREVESINPGATVEIHPDDLAFPASFSNLPKGDYYVMALLDVDHNAAYRLYSAGDLKSSVTELKALDPSNSAPVELTLNSRIPGHKLETIAGAEMIDFVSPSLTSFWGRPIHMRGVVVLPPDYEKSKDSYPTVYMTPGFGADIYSIAGPIASAYLQEMASGKTPPMIYVLLDESCPGGTHEFADSVNNGPWGHALTGELIPHLEQKYRMDARPSGRFLTGHSSGGWATLWLQTAYPKVFGGTWSTSPDPSDFRDFTGPDLVDGNNVYHKSDGSPFMLVRMGGKDVTSIEQYAKQERVLGPYGGQFASFEWVFSPRGPDGRPMQMFDRDTGAIHHEVASYWEDHYDIANLLRENWKLIGPDLKGKIHVIVGTADTFHLEGPAHLLDTTLQQLGGDAKFTYLEGRTHFDLYMGGLQEQIAKEMYAIARPAKAKAAASGQ